MNISGLMKTTLLDYPGHMACTVFTGGCNFRCPFCHNADLLPMDVAPEYTEEEIFAFLEKRKGTLDGVAITGGEPTMQKDLPDFIRRVRQQTGLKIKLDSNGTNPAMLKALLDEGLIDYVAMDIKAGIKKYLKAAGVEKNANGDAIMKAITESKDMIMQYGSETACPSGKKVIDYEFRTTVVGGLHELGDFEEIKEYIKGAKKYFLQCYKDSGNILDKTADLREPTKEELLTYMETVKPYVNEISIRGVDY